ncbi:MAG: extracellular solute-binding protein [Lachnospiraceae bacterium]|nr:extracellular solute-binding protein [Lachnospiraceae bacterium]
MKKRKQTGTILLSSVLAISMMVGCGGSGNQTAESEKSSETESGTSADQVVLTYWGWDSQFYKPLMDAYMKKNPNITFEVTEVASTDYVTKVQQTLASGSELPDLMASESSYRGQMLSIDMWEDLTQAPYNVREDMFFDYAVGKMENSDGKIVCIDETVCPAVFAYKRDMAKKYFGTDDPDELEAMFTSVDDVIEKAKEVHEESEGQVYLFATAGAVNAWLCNIKPMEVVDENGDVIFTKKFQEVFENMCKLRDAGGIDVIQQWTPQDNAAYADSNHIFYPAANWSAEYSIKPNDPDGSGNWGLMTPPGGGFSWGGTALGINKDSKNKDAAWDFIQYCTMTKEGVDLMKENADYYTPVKSFYDEPEFISKVDPYFGNQDVGKLLYGKVVPEMTVPAVTEYDGVCDEVLTMVLQSIMGDNNYTAEQALEDGITEVKNKLPDVTVK